MGIGQGSIAFQRVRVIRRTTTATVYRQSAGGESGRLANG